MALRILVTGGRRYPHDGYVWQVLDEVHRLREIACIIHGATPTRLGADWAADDWSKFHGVPRERYYVDTDLDGPWPAAGNRRNMRMFAMCSPDGIIAFPGGAGTAHMIGHAKSKGFTKIMDLREKGPR